MTTLFMCIYHALFNCLISIKIEIENGLHFINIIAYHCIACHNLLVSQCCATTCWSAHAVPQPAGQPMLCFNLPGGERQRAKGF